MKEEPKEASEKNTAEKQWWADTIKDLTSTGLATLFMTEDAVRGYLREKKLPKELVTGLLDGMSKKKDDLYGVIGQEIGKVFSKIDFTKEMTKFLENHKVVFNGKISFEPKDFQSKEDEKKSS